MQRNRIDKFIREKPEYAEILTAAVKVEEDPPEELVRRHGWKWHHVGAHPGRLTKLVSEGIVRVVSKGRGGHALQAGGSRGRGEGPGRCLILPTSLGEPEVDDFDAIIGRSKQGDFERSSNMVKSSTIPGDGDASSSKS